MTELAIAETIVATRAMDDASTNVHTALSAVVREDRARLLAVLVRSYGFSLAEDSLDAAIEAAVLQWKTEGIPRDPCAWLLRVARRRAIDALRHRSMAKEAHEALLAFAERESNELDDPARHVPDERLRLLFTCCHPAIAQETQVALALRWLSGLSTEEVARAFCVSVSTMAQRLTRAKSKIEEARVPYEIPEKTELPERLDAVLEVVYAIFNEGYVATSGDALQRVDLAEEALRLAELVTLLLPEQTKARAMLSLLLLIHARRAARVDRDGVMIPLEEQDRTQWDQKMISRGKTLLKSALREGPPSAYAIEAAIQALHDEASAYETTDFAQIAMLYAMLRRNADSPVIALNEAVARCTLDGLSVTLERLQALEQNELLEAHPAVHAAKADVLKKMGRSAEARVAYALAASLTKNHAEQAFLLRCGSAL